MADNKEAEAVATDVDIPDGDAKTILGLPKSLFIKVAIGFVVLMLAAAGGAVFLLGSDTEEAVAVDEEVDLADDQGDVMTDDTIDSDGLLSENEDDTGEADSIDAPQALLDEIATLRQQSDAMRNEMTELKAFVIALQNELSRLKQSGQTQADRTFLNTYGDDENAFPPIQTDPPKPRPEPRWGDFKRPAN